MTPLITTSEVEVELVRHSGDDFSIVQAAKVSVVGGNDFDYSYLDEKNVKQASGLINYLMKERHGSPFEHNSVTFYIKAPIFVFREFMRHRIASYNEMSGRYTELPGEFYLPDRRRKLVNSGGSARPKFEYGTEEQYSVMADAYMKSYETAWAKYQEMIDAGIANEVARAVLPVGIMSQMYVTMNLRSILNFLSLRVLDHPDESVPTRPQYEINLVAREMEDIVSKHFPLAMKSFNDNGRVAP